MVARPQEAAPVCSNLCTLVAASVIFFQIFVKNIVFRSLDHQAPITVINSIV